LTYTYGVALVAQVVQMPLVEVAMEPLDITLKRQLIQ
tara:strand:+ start:205 stop:315 length:111 start_codon:yes stop_codon:yes gene_type:complete